MGKGHYRIYREHKLKRFLRKAEDWEIDYLLSAIVTEQKLREDTAHDADDLRLNFKKSYSSLWRSGVILATMSVPALSITALSGYGFVRLLQDLLVHIANYSIGDFFISVIRIFAVIILCGMAVTCLIGSIVFFHGGTKYLRLSRLIRFTTREKEDFLSFEEEELKQAMKGRANKTIIFPSPD